MVIKTTRDLIRATCKATGLVNKGRLAIRTPIGLLMKGYVFDSSAYSKTSFYLNVLIQPTYMPVEYIFLTYGGRLKSREGRRRFELDLENPDQTLEEVLIAIQNEGEPFLNSVESVSDFAILSEQAPRLGFGGWVARDINVLEARAYSWALAGRIEKAVQCLLEIEQQQKKDPDDRDWVLDLVNRAIQMRTMLKETKVDEFRSILDGWRKDFLASQRLADVATENI